MTKGEIAKLNFESGLNCAQAVVLAFKDEMGLSELELKKLIIGFGGGFAAHRRKMTDWSKSQQIIFICVTF